MHTPVWLFTLNVLGSLASIISVIFLILKRTWHRVILTAAVCLPTFFLLFFAIRGESILRDEVTIHAGAVQVADFLDLLSQGSLKIIMDRKVAEDLRRKHVKIDVPELKNVRLGDVLEQIVLRQLPGPEQWTYDVLGQTVRIKRR